MEARELLVDPGGGVVSVDDRIGQLEPATPLTLVDHVRAGVRGALEVPARHHVGVGVVVDVLVVLVGADHAADVTASVRVGLDPRRPPAGGLHDQLAPRTGRERLVAGPVDVAGGGPRDVGDDVLLERAGEDRYEFAVPVTRVIRRDIPTGPRGLPGETGAVALLGACGAHRRGQAPDAVLEHRPRRLRVGRGKASAVRTRRCPRTRAPGRRCRSALGPRPLPRRDPARSRAGGRSRT